MGYFDDLLAKVPAEDRAVLDKYPDLKASMSQMETALAQANQYADGWDAWKAENWDAEAGMTKREKFLADQLQTRSTAPTGFDPKTLRDEFSNKLKEVEEGNARTLAGLALFNKTVLNHAFQHQSEFGETLNPDSLMDFMTKNRITDPELAYERMFAPKRQEISQKNAEALEAKHKEELAAAEQRGRETAMREATMGNPGGLPTDSTGGIAGITARINAPVTVSDEQKAALGQAKLGDGSIAQMGYEAYRRGELPVQ